MHAVFFGVKRVHIETVRMTNALIGFTSLTAARFDLMRVVQIHPEGIHQSTLRWLLGVTAPVVSRMLKALQLLGLVAREKDVADGRCLIVKLTERGLVAVRVAKGTVVDFDGAERIAARVVSGSRRVEVTASEETTAIIDASRQQVATLDSLLLNARHALFDRAPYHHPWQIPPFFMPTPFLALAAARMRELLPPGPRAASPAPRLAKGPREPRRPREPRAQRRIRSEPRLDGP